MFALFGSVTSLTAVTFGPEFYGYTLTPIPYQASSQANPGIPVSYGALAFRPNNSGILLVGGNIAGSGAALYAVSTIRNFQQQIIGLSGPATVFAKTPKLANGAVEDGSTRRVFYTIESGSGGVDLGVIPPGSPSSCGYDRDPCPTYPTFNVVPDTPGSVQWSRHGVPLPGRLKLLTMNGMFYTANEVSAQLETTIPGTNLGAFVYVRPGSFGFPSESMLVAETNAAAIVAYNIDTFGNPVAATRRVFASGTPLEGVSGMVIDPQTGDLIVSTRRNSSSGIYRIGPFRADFPSPDVTVSQCREISSPGRYTLTADVSAATGTCVYIHDTSDVLLDCNGHKLRGSLALHIARVEHFAVNRCTIESTQLGAGTFTVSNSRRGSIAGNTIGNLTEDLDFWLTMVDVSNTQVTENTINGVFVQERTLDNKLRGNRITISRRPNGANFLIYSRRGVANGFESNILNGEMNRNQGLQSAMLLWDEGGVGVIRNQIRNARDVGIETRGIIENAVIQENTIDQTPLGILGEQWNSWSSVRVINNTIINADRLFVLRRRFGLRPINWDGASAPADTGVFFTNNLFQGNRFVARAGSASTEAALLPIFANLDFAAVPLSNLIPGETPVQDSDLQLTGNTFNQNDFGQVLPAPVFGVPVVAGRISDGGGNKCKTPTPAGFPLTCQ